MLPPCTRKSLVYENVCAICNSGAGAKEELKDVNPNIPSIYVGGTSRTIQERAMEHWASAKGSSNKSKEGSHMRTHMEQQHGGGEPAFIMRVVEFHRTALSRQTGEAVRILRRGGAGSILNSRGEFNRCYIPRLRVEEPSKIEELEKWEEEEVERAMTTLREEDMLWERSKIAMNSTRSYGGKRGKRGDREQPIDGRRKKRLKYDLLEDDWGHRMTTCGQEWDDALVEPGGEREEEKEEPSSELPSKIEGAAAEMGANSHSSQGGPDDPPSTECGPAQSLPKPTAVRLKGGEVTIGMAEIGTVGQLHSPCCSKQAGIMQYFQTKTIGSFPDKSIGTQSMGEGESIELEESIQMTDQDISSLTIKNISTYEQLTAPSVKEMGKPAAVRLEEEVRIEDDILKQTTSVNTTECVLDKKKLRCLEHECAIKVMNVSSKKWQWIGKKKEFGYVCKKSKKYICEGMRQKQPVRGSCQVQPMVTENVDTGNQTTVYKEKENDISGLEGTSKVYSGVGSGSMV